MQMFTVISEYYDKRGHIRSKKKICCGEDMLLKECKRLNDLEDSELASTPRVLRNTSMDRFDREYDFYDILNKNYTNYWFV